MRTFHIVKAVAAPPALVWNVLADYPGMTKWAGARTVDIERPGPRRSERRRHHPRAQVVARDDPRGDHRLRARTANQLQGPLWGSRP